MTYFVWMRGQKGPFPQKWYNLPTDGNGKPTAQAIFVKELDDGENALSLDELAERYKDQKNA